MTERHIVAMGGGGFSDDDPLLDRFAVDLTDAARPRICFLPTASGDSLTYLLRFFEAFPSRSFDTSVLHLFGRQVSDVVSFLGEQDVIYVGGGNTANMLAVWRLHGVDGALRAAWEAGVVCCGVSAGANCWFEASATDSFLMGSADPLEDGLGFLSGSFCPHYTSEERRRPDFQRLISQGRLAPGIGCEDFAAVHFTGPDLSETVASRAGAGAYRIVPGDGSIVEERLPVRALV